MPADKKKKEKKAKPETGKKTGRSRQKNRPDSPAGEFGSGQKGSTAAAKKSTRSGKKSGPGAGKSAAPARRDNAAKTAPAKKETGTMNAETPSYYVGIGSSAGGLEALKEFFENLPGDSSMAFILVPHLDPNRKSLMAELLQRHTSMPVSQVEDGMKVRADHVYIIPPDRMLGIIDGTLQLLQTKEDRVIRHSIDYFFRTLAGDQGDRTIGVILSGTGTEGVVGIKDVKEGGGLVIVQEPASAKYDGMPSSAIKTGLVDFILPPAEIPGELLRYTRKKFREVEPAGWKAIQNNLPKLTLIIRSGTDHDFSNYKPKTLIRRIERRMVVNQIDTVEEYIRYLQHNPDEVEMLFKEILIRVTNFFRDPEAFKILQDRILPQLIQNASDKNPLRVWIPACSTGEEAYSVAILIQEYADKHRKGFRTQVFATDIDTQAIEIARAGLYSAAIEVDVSADRLKKYFTREDNSYRVNKKIREMVVFANHNVIKDPPFSKMDIICCRNLLIYLNSKLQQKLVTVFHYALKPDGILFLGSSESIGAGADLFAAVDSKWKLYKPLDSPIYYNDERMPPRYREEEDRTVADTPDLSATGRHIALGELIKQVLLDLYAPAAVIIKKDGTILYFYGRTGKYLEPAPGRANLNILGMIRKELRTSLRLAIREITSGQQESLHPGLRIRTDGTLLTCNLKVTRIRRPDHMKGLILVSFEEVEEKPRAAPGKKDVAEQPEHGDAVEELEHELNSVKEDLQSTIEELEVSNEELQSANEELQSTNEELETSREELQSVNEELMTVNAEEQEKIEQLLHATDDMKNLLASTEILTIFLDMDLRIKNFTPDAVRVFKLIDSDIGRPISDIVNTLHDVNLLTALQEVLNTLIPGEQQVYDEKGYWYLMKILPYRKGDNIIAGVVLTLVDISRQKHTEVLLVESEERKAVLLDQSEHAYILIDSATGFITDSNPAFQKMIGKHAWEIKELKIWELMSHDVMNRIRRTYTDGKGKSLNGEHTEEFLGPNGSRFQVRINCRPITIGTRKYFQCLLQKNDE